MSLFLGKNLPPLQDAMKTGNPYGTARMTVLRNLSRTRATLLLVEHDTMVRAVVRETLIAQGYDTQVCRDGCEALMTLGRHVGPIALLLTDLMLPGMTGQELSERARLLRPNLKTLFMSGYPRPIVGPDRASVPYLQKPFGPLELLVEVRAVLDGEVDANGMAGRRPGHDKEETNLFAGSTRLGDALWPKF